MMVQSVTLFGIPFCRQTATEARERIAELLQKRTNAKIFTPNPDILRQASKSETLANLLRSGDLLLPDGIGVVIAARLLGTPLPERIPGIDTAEWVLRYASERGLSVYLLGGKAGVAQQAAERLRERFAGLTVCGTHHGYFDLCHASADNQALLADIRQKCPDILLVCLGFPRQEQWIAENTPLLPSLRLSMGLGGSLDVWSGNVRRAPRLFRQCGIEWLWRALRQPRRFRSLLTIPPFLLAAAKQKQL